MPVSGLVITLAPPPPDTSPDIPPDTPLEASPDAPTDTPGVSGGLHNSSALVIEQINQHPLLQAGPLQGHRLPVVVDTPDRETDKQCWLWLNELAGVHHVDVAFVHFEDEDAFEHSPCKPSKPQTDQLITAPTIGET